MVVADDDAILRDLGRSDEQPVPNDSDEAKKEEKVDLVGEEEADDDSHPSTPLDASEASRKVYHAPEMLPDEFELRARALLARGSRQYIYLTLFFSFCRITCVRTNR